MTEAQTDHLRRIRQHFELLLNDKYRAGVAEHGGNLWQKPGMLGLAEDEAVDQVTYLLTLREQLQDVMRLLDQSVAVPPCVIEARARLQMILEPPSE